MTTRAGREAGRSGAGAQTLDPSAPHNPETPVSRAALDNLFRTQGPRLMAFFARRLGPEEARDLAQETFLWGGEPQTMSPDELMTAWRGIVPGFDATWHEISDLKVRVAGETAMASSRVDGRHWIGERTWHPIGRYNFQLRRQDGQWCVTRMTLTVTQELGDRALVELARARAAQPVK